MAMTSDLFIQICRERVADYFNTHSDVTDNVQMNPEDVYVVWYCKTLQNYKALISTPVSDGMYYEVTYNGDKNEVYLDAYKKWTNIKFDLNTWVNRLC